MTEEKSSTPDYIKVEGPDVFFDRDVSVDSVAELCTAVKKIERDYYETIVRIDIHSDGGTSRRLAAMDSLRSCKSRHRDDRRGECVRRAATFIFLGGDKRIVEPNAYLLIHQLGSDFWGKYEDMKDEMKECDRFDETHEEDLPS
jgi:ATP-dependent protease ClpP protease subunit